jgi:two-component system, oxyanion-binding sensor
LAYATAVTAQQGAMTLASNTFFDGRSFDPDDIEGYIASFA